MRFAAIEAFAIDRTAFVWRARFPILGPIAIQVFDGYADGRGELAVKLFGIPIQHQRGHDTTIGEANRRWCQSRRGASPIRLCVTGSR